MKLVRFSPLILALVDGVRLQCNTAYSTVATRLNRHEQNRHCLWSCKTWCEGRLFDHEEDARLCLVPHGASGCSIAFVDEQQTDVRTCVPSIDSGEERKAQDYLLMRVFPEGLSYSDLHRIQQIYLPLTSDGSEVGLEEVRIGLAQVIEMSDTECQFVAKGADSTSEGAKVNLAESSVLVLSGTLLHSLVTNNVTMTGISMWVHMPAVHLQAQNTQRYRVTYERHPSRRILVDTKRLIIH